jgi:hypothetical protein
MTTKNTTTPLARNLAVLGALAAVALLQVACCDGGPLEPNTAGCAFDQAAVAGDTVAVLEILGGTAGANDEYVVRIDGTIKHVDRLTGTAQDRVVPGGPARTAQLVVALDASGVRDVEQGCYPNENEAVDALIIRLILQQDSVLSFFGNDCGSGPTELVAAVDLLKAYVNEAR